MSSPRVYWRGRIHLLGRIGGYENPELAFLFTHFAFFQLAHGAQSERELADMQATELADIEARLCKLELADMQARLRKLESVGGGRCGRADRQEPTAPTGKCFTCGQVGCKSSTCPNGNQDAQQKQFFSFNELSECTKSI